MCYSRSQIIAQCVAQGQGRSGDLGGPEPGSFRMLAALFPLPYEMAFLRRMYVSQNRRQIGRLLRKFWDIIHVIMGYGANCHWRMNGNNRWKDLSIDLRSPRLLRRALHINIIALLRGRRTLVSQTFRGLAAKGDNVFEAGAGYANLWFCLGESESFFHRGSSIGIIWIAPAKGRAMALREDM